MGSLLWHYQRSPSHNHRSLRRLAFARLLMRWLEIVQAPNPMPIIAWLIGHKKLWNTHKTSWNTCKTGVIHCEPLVKQHEIIIKHCETSWNTHHSMRRYRCSMWQHRHSMLDISPHLGVSGDIDDCSVGLTLQICNRVTNPWDTGIFYRPDNRVTNLWDRVVFLDLSHYVWHFQWSQHSSTPLLLIVELVKLCRCVADLLMLLIMVFFFQTGFPPT